MKLYFKFLLIYLINSLIERMAAVIDSLTVGARATDPIDQQDAEPQTVVSITSSYPEEEPTRPELVRNDQNFVHILL